MIPGRTRPSSSLLRRRISWGEENSQRDPVDGAFHGAFTAALLQVLRDPATSPNESAELGACSKRVQAIMRWYGRVQVPVLKGTENNHRRALFGTVQGALAGRIVLALQGVRGDTAILDGGLAFGLGPGSELHSANNTGGTIRLRLATEPSASSSRAVAIAGTLNSAVPGMLFVVDKWLSTIAGTMRLWIPAPVDSGELKAAITRLQPLRTSAEVEWVDDPTALADDGRPLYVIERQRSSWRLRAPDQTVVTLQVLSAPAVLETIAAHRQPLQPKKGVAASSAAAALQNAKPRLYLFLPPTWKLERAIQKDLGSSFPFRVAPGADSADYALFGAFDGDSLRYAWVLPERHAILAAAITTSSANRVADRITRTIGIAHRPNPSG